MASYSGCSYSTLPNVSLGNVDCSICVSENNYDVTASITVRDHIVSLDAYYNWTMYLEKKTSNGWTNVASRTGYVTPDSPSTRTFTNVSTAGQTMRVAVLFEYSNGQYVTTKYSPSWVRK